MTIEELAKLLPRKFNDHRDFYPLASLISQGLVEDSLTPFSTNSPTIQAQGDKTQIIAWKLCAISGADKSASYRGHTWSIHGGEETLKDQRCALTGAGYLFLEEARVRRNDRVFAIILAVASAVIAAYFTTYFQAYAAGI